jgi:hypothetical protein
VLFSKHKAHGSPVVGWHSSLVCTEGTPAACCPCKAIGRKVSWQRHSNAFRFAIHRANLCTRATGVSTYMLIRPDCKRRRATLQNPLRKTLQSSTPQIRKLWWFQRTWDCCKFQRPACCIILCSVCLIELASFFSQQLEAASSGCCCPSCSIQQPRSL